MRKLFLWVAVLALACAPVVAADDNEREARRIITEFQEGLAAHDVTKIEPLVAADMVAFENGHRNHSWQDFRDNHLLPEFKGPAPPMEWEFIKVVATQQMVWGYTLSTFSTTRRNGDKVDLQLWSIYVLEKRGGQWKVTVLDWSLGRVRR